MNNSRDNACSPWKCKQSAARTARWTRQSPEKWEDFCFIIVFFYYYHQILYILMRSVSLGDCLCKALHLMQTHRCEQEGPNTESKHTLPSQRCCGLYLSAEAAEQHVSWMWRFRWRLSVPPNAPGNSLGPARGLLTLRQLWGLWTSLRSQSNCQLVSASSACLLARW